MKLKEMLSLPLHTQVATTINYSSMSAEDIYLAGWKLSSGGKLGFDSKKGLDALIQKDKDGKYIYSSGKFWPIFDYEKGLDALIQKSKTGEYIFYAGKNWKQCNYEKAIKALQKIGGKWYNDTIKGWPKGVEDVKAETQRLRDTSTKFPNKKLRLK
jgi:hypothetical protein